ncbi:MAG: PQQ-binding-like beta-propeller repeat protein, partial [Planctomycetaceae bacterium]|nr:PQQ-binding-like beta-propeller repeat protein [Planctomycetaceae bacterium]
MTSFFRTNSLVQSAVVTVLLTVAASSSGQESRDLKGLGDLKLEQRWVSQATLNVRRDHVNWISNDEDIIFVQSSGGVLTALNAENGRKLWARQLGRADEFVYAPVSDTQLVLITSGPVLYAFDKFTGDEKFEYRLPMQPSAPPALVHDDSAVATGADNGPLGSAAVRDRYCYIPMSDGSLYAYNLANLEYLKRFGKLPPLAERAFSWRFLTASPIRFAPVVGNENIAFGTDQGSLHGLSARSVVPGTTNFELITNHPIATPLTFVERLEGEYCVFATDAGRIFCLMLSDNGRQVWARALARPISGKMIAVDDDLFVATQGDGLHVISLSQGAPRISDSGAWINSDARAVRAITGGFVYAVDSSNRLLQIDRETGTTLKHLDLHEYSMGIQNEVTDRLYFVTSSGRVLCLGVQGEDFATYHQNPERRPIMPEVPEKEPQPAA